MLKAVSVIIPNTWSTYRWSQSALSYSALRTCTGVVNTSLVDSLPTFTHTSTWGNTNTEKIYIKMFNEIAHKYNTEFTWEARMKVMGTVEKDTAKIMVEELNLPITPEQFSKHQQEYGEIMLAECDLMPGAERLVRHLHSKGIPIAVATSSSMSSVQVKTSSHKALFSLFHHIVSGSTDPEVKNGKPAPDVFLVCCSRFPDKPSPSQCLVLEDAPNGVLAGRSAGMQVIMVPDPATEESSRKGATMILQSLNDFQPELFGLPPF